MKKFKIISIIAIVIFMMTSQSCKKGFFEGVNDSVDYPTEVTPRVLLPGAEGSLAYTQGGDVERYTGLMSQYVSGAFRQFFGYNQYVFTEEDFNNMWNNMYAGTMENFKVIMNTEEANPGDYTIYDGIARILMAYSLGMSTDMWGDVPYDQAFQGSENLTPTYQTQEEIYAEIQTLLDQAIDEMTNDPGDDVDAPDANDYIFQGDVASWISFAQALKARYYIHLTNVDPNAAQNALDAINNGSAMADAGYPFSSSGQSPWFQYIDQRDDIIYSADGAYFGYGVVLPDPAAIGTMIARADPRYPVYIDVAGDYGHWAPGYLGPFFQSDDASVWLMTEFERQFIKAEAMLRTGDQGGAQTALNDAINASFVFYGLDPSAPDAVAYVGTYATLTGNIDADLEIIITEKWIANFLRPESWVDIRRTGFPVLTPNSGGSIPSRFIYPTNERLYNPNGINQNSDMFTPHMWWEG